MSKMTRTSLDANVFRLLSASGDGEWNDRRPPDLSQFHSIELVLRTLETLSGAP